MSNSKALVGWRATGGVTIPPAVMTASALVPYANGLTGREQKKVVDAVEAELFDMGAEFVWRRAMTRLKDTIAALGMPFVAEMLDRSEVADATSIDAVLTDYDAIRLAEALGIINATGALRLHQARELLSHLASTAASEELGLPEAVTIIKACIQHVLGEEKVDVAVDFLDVRSKLLSSPLDKDSPTIESLLAQPPFFLGTAIRVLLSAVRSEKGSRLQVALLNLNALVPQAWKRLGEKDRWALGEVYTEANASGRSSVVAELRRVLEVVHGFDYVPENLRSQVYKRAAQAVVAAHFSFNNFYNEGAPTRALVNLGTTIPKNALGECVQALLLVYIGNRYGSSFDAAAAARPELLRFQPPQWKYYFVDFLRTDDKILGELTEEKPAQRFVQLFQEISVADPVEFGVSGELKRLLVGAQTQSSKKVQGAAANLLRDFKPTA
jgi:hypothetical protein